MNKIYTKKGDQGETCLINGEKISKAYERLEVLGSLDELNSFVGLLKVEILDLGKKEKIPPTPFKKREIKGFLENIQKNIYTINSILAGSDNVLNKEEVNFLEKEIDKMELELPELTKFISPGENKAESISHICRAITRRVERRIAVFSKKESFIEILKYINRLSDYFFVLARFLSR